MIMVLRTLGVSIAGAALGAGIGYILFERVPDPTGICFVLGCVGAIVGAVAGAGVDIAAALRQRK